jgi:hypothetical protein
VSGGEVGTKLGLHELSHVGEVRNLESPWWLNQASCVRAEKAWISTMCNRLKFKQERQLSM